MPILQFKGKTAVENYHRVVPHHLLEVDKKLSLSKKPSLEGNLIIEGDNLIALKSLLPTHAGRIKCIYIDPPYNTGNEGWVYNDNLTQPQFKEWIGKTVGKEGEDATRHDKWCCMMYPRLHLLRELLRDDGAVFISIDDIEVGHLRLLMDEIFGQENFVATVIWQKVFAPKPAAKTFSTSCEYIVVYGKCIERWDRILLPRTAEQDERYTNPDNDPRGPWASDNLLRNEHRDNSVYTIQSPSGRKWKPEPGTRWRHPESEMLELIGNGEIWFGEDGNNMPRRKKFLRDVQQGLVPETLWTYDEVGHTQDAKRALTQILGSSRDFFQFPKPIGLIKRIAQICVRPDEYFLDSFAGSGTTANAILDLNQQDGGQRKFILVQIPYETKEQAEKGLNICKQITQERISRVIQGYTSVDSSGKKRKAPGLGGEFTYARVGKSLFSEYRDLGKELPSYEQLAQYIWYTETSTPFDPKGMESKTGKIGVSGDTSYYLLYDPRQKEGRALDLDFLRGLKDKNKRKVVYCEKIWLHRDELAKFGQEIRPMLVPFNLK